MVRRLKNETDNVICVYINLKKKKKILVVVVLWLSEHIIYELNTFIKTFFPQQILVLREIKHDGDKCILSFMNNPCQHLLWN